MTTQGASAPVKTLEAEPLKPCSLNPRISQAYDVSTNYSWRDGPLAVQSSVQSLQQKTTSQIFSAIGKIWGVPEHNRAGIGDKAIAMAQKAASITGLVEPPAPATTVFYVFIPLLHYPEYAAGLINDNTYKNLLTKVKAGQDDSFSQGKTVQIQFTDSDHSEAHFVQIIDNKNLRMQNLVSQMKGMQLAALCNVPSAKPVIPSPASKPSYEVLENVGYVQLTYALALWAVRQPGSAYVSIASIKYPFPNVLLPNTEVGSLGMSLVRQIGELITGATKYNKEAASAAATAKSAATGWVNRAGILSSNATLVYSPELVTDSRVEVVVQHATKIGPLISKFKEYTQGYNIVVSSDPVALSTAATAELAESGETVTKLYFKFTEDDTAGAVRMTTQRLRMFFSKLNQKVLQDTKKLAPPPGVPLQSVQPAACGDVSGGEISGYGAILPSVPALQISMRPRKSCSKKTCVVLHEPAASSGNAAKLINFARGKCLYNNKQLLEKIKQGIVPNLVDAKGKVLCPQGADWRGFSLHFVVGTKQSFQTLPYEKCGRAHANTLNNKSIGVEFVACRATGLASKGSKWAKIPKGHRRFYGQYLESFPTVANFEQVWTIVKASAKKSGIKIQNKFYLGGKGARVWTLGKLTSGAGKGVLAHRREKVTDHQDGLVPELYCLLRWDGFSPTEAYKKARTACQMFAKDGFKSSSKINIQKMEWA